MKTKHIPIVVLACCAFFAVGCRTKTTTHSDLNASSGGRDVHVSADSGAWVHAEENRLSVTLPGHEIVIEKERLLVDKTERTKVSPGAKKFDVVSAGGTLTVTADGAEILQTPLKN